MSKLYFLALLFYNITLIYSTVHDTNAYGDPEDNARFNLMDLVARLAEKSGDYRRDTTDRSLENWTGRWMPARPGDPTPPPKVFPISEVTQAPANQVAMGSDDTCDNGKTNLSVDWDNSPVNYTCYGSKITPDLEKKALLYIDTIPHAYSAIHKCMNEQIEYDSDVPLYGTHRPVWPVYGEYKFVPRQRWLHSLEHGAVVMLYHPCANPLEVKRLKTLVTSCLRRHIISPYSLLDEDRPLALLTWGYRLSMSYVNPGVVINFIRRQALRGPEMIASDGEFVEGLIHKANTVSDYGDSVLCPKM